MDIVSAQGNYFRSSNQNNQYGTTPNFNTLFIGTDGMFGIPLRASFKLKKQLPL
jgi:FAD/FMN-containing dehydrogenase